MRLGIVSDSHGDAESTREAVRMLDSLQVERVLHCGDIGSSAVVEQFALWPTDFVTGNCDYHDRMAETVAKAGNKCHGAFGDLQIGGRRIALLHGDNRAKLLEVIDSGDWDLVCYGHTHQASIERHGRTLVLNPGALHRASPHTIAIVELQELEASIIAI